MNTTNCALQFDQPRLLTTLSSAVNVQFHCSCPMFVSSCYTVILTL